MNARLFSALVALIESGKFTLVSSKQMLINSLFSLCQSEEHRGMILTYFKDGNITINGNIICDSFTTKQRHTMVKKIFASQTISQASKDEVMLVLEQIDNSDLLAQTKAYC